MSLVGSLEDLGLGDILQIVSLSRKSGILHLGWGEVKGRIFFRDGQVVAATTTGDKRTLGSVLGERLYEFKNLVSPLGDPRATPQEKTEFIDRAVNALPDAAHVREALVRDLRFPESAVENAVRDQIESTVFHFFSWPEGSFSFELQEIESELAAFSAPEHAFILEPGLSPQFLAMEGTRLQDERKRAREEAPVGPPLRGGIPGRPEKSRVEECAETPTPAEPDGPAETPSPGRARPGDAETDFGSVSEALAYYESHGGPPEPAPVPSEESPSPRVSERPEPGPSASEPARAPEPTRGPDISATAGPAAPVAAFTELVIVDDDPFTLASLVHHLAARGHRIKTFGDVPAALSFIQSAVDLGSRPATVIADLMMPDISGASTLGGLEVLEKTRKINPAISVYLMTDYENLTAQARALELGARFFFTKPKSSQLDEDYGSPELVNFVQVLENALQSEPRREPGLLPQGAPPGEKMVNLGEELRREFGEDVEPMSAEAAGVVSSRGLHMLKTMINELNDPGSSGQITLLILRFASEMMNRAVIFVVAKNQLAGLGQFGIALDGADAQKEVRKIRIPLAESSIFREAVQKRMPLKKALKPNKWNDYLVQALGGAAPREVFVSPIIAGGKIAALIYGDNAPEDKEIGDTESLEIFLAQAGLAMEKALLERRLREMGNPESAVGPGANGAVMGK